MVQVNRPPHNEVPEELAFGPHGDFYRRLLDDFDRLWLRSGGDIDLVAESGTNADPANIGARVALRL